MRWNWQQKDWPKFVYDPELLAQREHLFQRESGIVIGSFRHMDASEKNRLIIELISTEAVNTSEIEGEILDRSSIQSSLRQKFGLRDQAKRIKPAEQGIAEMLGDLYQSYEKALTHQTLYEWHNFVMAGRKDLTSVGGFRTHSEPMLIVSGAMHAPQIHFEAPPSSEIPKEMERFMEWYNATHPDGDQGLPALTRAGIAHLYFVCIHPFEDGNGRIGRALAEKALAQGIGQAAITAFSMIIQKKRNQYYRELEIANKDLSIDRWLNWFADIVLEAQGHSLRWVNFLIYKGRLLGRLKTEINPRQKKALLRIMREGPHGFRGGLSAKNYMRITGASPATARRDLAQLVELEALRRTGENKGTRYWLTFGL